MKLAWTQILLSLVLGFSLGIFFDKSNIGRNCCGKCPCALMESCKKWNCKHCPHKDGKNNLLEHISSELKLTEDQKTKVAAILKSKHEQIKKIREEVRKSSHDEINKILTAEQKTKFEEISVQFDSMRKKIHKGFEEN